MAFEAVPAAIAESGRNVLLPRSPHPSRLAKRRRPAEREFIDRPMSVLDASALPALLSAEPGHGSSADLGSALRRRGNRIAASPERRNAHPRSGAAFSAVAPRRAT